MQSNTYGAGGWNLSKKGLDQWLVFQAHLSNMRWEPATQGPGLREARSRTHSVRIEASTPAPLIRPHPHQSLATERRIQFNSPLLNHSLLTLRSFLLCLQRDWAGGGESNLSQLKQWAITVTVSICRGWTAVFCCLFILFNCSNYPSAWTLH